MTDKEYVAPQHKKDAYHCPHCGAYAAQLWADLARLKGSALQPLPAWQSAVCQRCGETSIWHADNMVFPLSGAAPLPNSDFPADMKADYEEARTIASRSPRGAAALLRLIVQKMCIHLGQPGKNINDDIAALVKDGLPSRVQRALDSVRVIGNDAVHPGMIDLRDNPAMAAALFSLVNFIAEKMISEPKELEAIYAALPDEKRKAIERRDT